MPVEVRVEGDYRLVDDKGNSRSCGAPCVLSVTPGFHTFVRGGYEEKILIDAPSALEFREGSPSTRLVGGVVFGVGFLTALVAGYGGLKVCEKRTISGVYDSPCERGADAESRQGLQYGLFAAAGVGFTAGVIGGFLYFGAGPSVKVIDKTTASLKLVPTTNGLALTGAF